MRSFNMGGGYGSDNPWFRVGNIDVTTTIFIVGAGLASMVLWAVEGAPWRISRLLVLGSRASNEIVFERSIAAGSVLDGQIWRLITWPIPNAPDFWTLILFAVFFMLSSQLEGAMGRRLFVIYTLAMILIPAVLVTLFELVSGNGGAVAGLRFLEIGVLVGFAARNPKAMFWPGIPAWVIAAVIVGIDFLQYLGLRQSHSIVMLFSVIGVSLLMIRALGFADRSEWIPKLALPAAVTGAPRPASTSRGRSTTKRKRRSRANLSVAPSPTAAPRRELSKLEEAEMDAILDQVGERGMDSLTPQQRARLEDHSKRLRRRDD